MTILKFTCPKCGGHDLVSNETSKETYRVDSITDDPKADSPIVYVDKYDMVDHWKDDFSCRTCGYKFFMTEKQLVEWIKKNCPQ